MAITIWVIIGFAVGYWIAKLMIENASVKSRIWFIWLNKSKLIWTAYLILLLLVVKNNWAFLAHPRIPNTFADLQLQMYRNPGNIVLLHWSIFLILAGIVAFVAKFPFQDWESLKFGIFEGKRNVQEVKQIAKDNMVREIKIEEARLAVVEIYTSEPMYLNVYARIENNNGEFMAIQLIELFLEKYVQTMAAVKVDMDATVVTVQNGIISDYQSQPQFVRNLIKSPRVTRSVENAQEIFRRDFMGESSIATKVTFWGDDDKFYYICLTSTAFEFDSRDFTVLSVLKSMLDKYYVLASLDWNIGADEDAS